MQKATEVPKAMEQMQKDFDGGFEIAASTKEASLKRGTDAEDAVIFRPRTSLVSVVSTLKSGLEK